MIRRAGAFYVLTTVVCLAAACGKKSPLQPSTVDTAAPPDANPATASIVAPRPLTPANNAQIRNIDQPVTLVVQNAVSTKPGLTYTFEVATEAAFASRVQTKDAVTEGSGGLTSVKLDTLAPEKDYYWHARAAGGGTTGVFGTAYKFTIGPAISVSAPVLRAPAEGARTTALVTFTVTNAVRSGPVGPITYKFELATSSSFSPVAITGTVNEGTTTTSFSPAAELIANTTYFWRVTAIDATNGIASAPSAAQSFSTALTIDLTKVVYLRGPSLTTWPRTATVTAIEQDGADPGPMCIRWTNSTYWPDVPFFGDPNFTIYANQWYFANINGTWYGGAAEWLYRGGSICKNGQGTFSIGPDSGFGAPFASWSPKIGELVGYAITSPARQWPSMRSVDERSQIVLVPWRDTSRGPDSGGVYLPSIASRVHR